MSSVGAQIKVEGFVQGVGFRYHCYKLANNLNITGWVRNNPNGSVSILAEGERSLIESLISDLRLGPTFAKVNDIKVTWQKYSGEYKAFEVVE